MSILQFPDRRVISYPVSPTAPAWVFGLVLAMNRARSPAEAWKVRLHLPYQLSEEIAGHQLHLVVNREYCPLGQAKRDPSKNYFGTSVSRVHYDIARRENLINAGGYFFAEDNPWDSHAALRAYREKMELFIAPWTVLQGDMT
jgi:hypothetical protein